MYPVCISPIWTSNPHQDKANSLVPVSDLPLLTMGLVKLFLFLLNTILTLYDLVTFPIYWMLMPAWTQRTKQNLGQVCMPEMSSKSVTVTRQKGESKIYQEHKLSQY